MKVETLHALVAARKHRRPVALITHLDSGQQVLMDAGHDGGMAGLSEAVRRLTREALEEGQNRLLETAAGPVFVHVFHPPPKMVLVGAVHIAQCLAPMAQLAGYQVVVVDPRRRFASVQRFADVEIRTQWPQTAFAELILDRHTAVVTLTHDPKLDDAALQLALNAPVFYIGSLGSRRTHAARLKRLARAGFSEQQLSRIHAPVGLPLGGRAPAEIAISILAQVTQLRYAHHRSLGESAEAPAAPAD